MAPLTHTPALLLQLKHIKRTNRDAASCMLVPVAVIGLQRQKEVLGLIIRHAIPESLKEDEVNLLVCLS